MNRVDAPLGDEGNGENAMSGRENIELMTESQKERMEVYSLNVAPVNLSRLLISGAQGDGPPRSRWNR